MFARMPLSSLCKQCLRNTVRLCGTSVRPTSRQCHTGEENSQAYSSAVRNSGKSSTEWPKKPSDRKHFHKSKLSNVRKIYHRRLGEQSSEETFQDEEQYLARRHLREEDTFGNLSAWESNRSSRESNRSSHKETINREHIKKIDGILAENSRAFSPDTELETSGLYRNISSTGVSRNRHEKAKHPVEGTKGRKRVEDGMFSDGSRMSGHDAEHRGRNAAIGDTESPSPSGTVSSSQGVESGLPEDWAEVFGTLAEEPEEQLVEINDDTNRYAEDEADGMGPAHPERRLHVAGRRHNPAWYGRQIEKLAKEGKIYEAIELVETRMLKEDHVAPTRYVFTVLIGALGRVGYTEKAFKLFNKMRNRGLTPEDPTYTALFNACANSPWPEDGLDRANRLRDQMAKQGYQPNLTTYKAMIKVYAHCGDMAAAFTLLEEIRQAKLGADQELYCFLLMACISNKEAGFKHAIEVWRMMRKKKIPPTIYHYNLLIRAINDCGLGSADFANQLLRSESQRRQLPAEESRNQTRLLSGGTDREQGGSFGEAPDEGTETWDMGRKGSRGKGRSITSSDDQMQHLTLTPLSEEDLVDEGPSASSRQLKDDNDDAIAGDGKSDTSQGWWHYSTDTKYDLTVINEEEKEEVAFGQTGASVFDLDVPNILNPRGRYDNVMALGELQTPAQRLALIGGLPGLLSHMTKDGVPPDIKTFAQLLQVLPSTASAEEDLMSAMTLHKVKPDVAFLNQLIRKHSLQRDYHGAKEVLGLFADLELAPNMQTFGCVAMSCRRGHQGLALLHDIKAAGYVGSVELFGILVHASHMDFTYKKRVCAEMKEQGVAPNKLFLQHVHRAIDKARQFIVKMERGEAVPGYVNNASFKSGFRAFMLFYKPWLLSMGVDVDKHPWSAFQQATPDEAAAAEAGDEMLPQWREEKSL